eukprot:gene30930-38226_t
MPYLYLPLSAVFNPRPGSWGHVSTIEGLLHHVLRRDYGTFQLFSGATGRNAEGFWTRCEAYVRDFSEEQGLGVAHVLAVLGVVASVVVTVSVAWKASTGSKKTNTVHSAAASTTPMQLVYFGVFHSLANLPLGDKLLFGVHQRFWMQPAVLSFVWVGVGYDVFAWSVVWVVDTAISSSSSKEVKRGSISGGGGGYTRSAPKMDYSDNYHFRNY